MSNYIPPKRDDFDSDERYQAFLEAYEAAVFMSEEMEIEKYYERR